MLAPWSVDLGEAGKGSHLDRGTTNRAPYVLVWVGVAVNCVKPIMNCSRTTVINPDIVTVKVELGLAVVTLSFLDLVHTFAHTDSSVVFWRSAIICLARLKMGRFELEMSGRNVLPQPRHSLDQPSTSRTAD